MATLPHQRIIITHRDARNMPGVDIKHTDGKRGYRRTIAHVQGGLGESLADTPNNCEISGYATIEGHYVQVWTTLGSGRVPGDWHLIGSGP